MVAYYQHDIAAWMDGTEGLDDGEYRVYHVLCELMYLNNGPIVLNERGLAGRCNQHILKFRINFQSLLTKKKLTVGGDGKIANGRTSRELNRILKKPQTPKQPQADSQPTPEQPPTNPGATSGQPPQGHARKPLKRKEQISLLDKTHTQEKRKDSPLPPKGATGCRLPHGWRPTDDLLAFARTKLPEHRVGSETDKFIDYWHGRADKGAEKVDWPATYRNWCRKAAENGGQNGNGGFYGRGREGGSASAAAGRLAELAERGEFTIGPRPSGVLSTPSGDDVRRLSAGPSGKS